MSGTEKKGKPEYQSCDNYSAYHTVSKCFMCKCKTKTLDFFFEGTLFFSETYFDDLCPTKFKFASKGKSNNYQYLYRLAYQLIII